jgi:hypothetical protein
MAGYLGPLGADEWLEMAHLDVPICCHMTIEPGSGRADWEHPDLRQCRGAATFRANVAKRPVDPAVVTGPVDHKVVFSSDKEFRDHHHNSLFDKWQRERGVK